MKRIYGVLETQFRNYFEMAERQKGVTGENLVRLLEQRLDNIVHRLGFAASRAQARVLVRHGHFRVNGRRVTIPSVLLKAGDVVEVQPKSRELIEIAAALEGAKKRRVPAWLEMDAGNFKGDGANAAQQGGDGHPGSGATGGCPVFEVARRGRG